MKVSFIIPLFNCLPLTQAMLASLRKTLPAGLECEIILVDDGSTDGTRDWLANLPAPCRPILNGQNLGFAGACNRGAAAATGEFLFFLNNDLVLLPGWLEPMLAVFARRPAAGIVGNVQLNAATGATDHTGIHFTHQGKPAHRTARPLTSRWPGWPADRRVAAVTGACFGLRRAAWEKLGGFDEGYRNGGEDIDLCLRAAAAGLRPHVALRSVVRHHIGASAGRALRNEENTRRLFRRWSGTIAALASRDWARHYLALHWEEPRNFEQPLVLTALWHHLGLLRRPRPALVQGALGAMQIELDRWRTLLDGVPPVPPPPPAPVRTDQI